MTTTSTPSTSLDPRDVSLDIGGMTCASCADRIEKRLNKLDGVTATVNYATEKAKVTVDRRHRHRPTSSPQVEAAGYTAAVRTDIATRSGIATATPASNPIDAHRCAHRLLIVDALLAVPVDAAGDDPGAAVRRLAVAVAHPRRTRSSSGAPGRSTGRRGRTCATAPPPWTR